MAPPVRQVFCFQGARGHVRHSPSRCRLGRASDSQRISSSSQSFAPSGGSSRWCVLALLHQDEGLRECRQDEVGATKEAARGSGSCVHICDEVCSPGQPHRHAAACRQAVPASGKDPRCQPAATKATTLGRTGCPPPVSASSTTLSSCESSARLKAGSPSSTPDTTTGRSGNPLLPKPLPVGAKTRCCQYLSWRQLQLHRAAVLMWFGIPWWCNTGLPFHPKAQLGQ